MLAKRWTLGVLMVLVGSIILTACAGEEKMVEVTRVVTEKETVVETVVEKEVAVEAAPLSRPIVFIQLEGEGETVSEKYDLSACDKAVFYWTAKPDEFGTASLVINMHRADADEEENLARAYKSKSLDIIEGETLRPLVSGKYYFTIENTDEPWTLQGECQDGHMPVGSRIKVAGSGPVVTYNYDLPTCTNSVFLWTIEPDAEGVASLTVNLHRVGEDGYETLVSESDSDVTEAIRGESLQPLSADIYFLSVEGVNGSWTLRWNCRD